MALVDFTTFDDVRAALGVSSDEIEDATLALAVYEFNLKDEMSEAGEEAVANSDLTSDYSTVAAKSPSDRTTAEQRLYETLRLFATYVVARHLTSALPMFAPKQQTDGKASLVRFTNDPYAQTVKAVTSLYDHYRARLIIAYARFKSLGTPVLTVRSYLSVVSPAVDPVTGQ